MSTDNFTTTEIIADIVRKNTWSYIYNSVYMRVFSIVDSSVREPPYSMMRNSADIPGNVGHSMYRGTDDAINNLVYL